MTMSNNRSRHLYSRLAVGLAMALAIGIASVSAAGQAAATQKPSVDIMLMTKPSPPKMGENTIEVMVKDAAGKPVTDAEVSAMFLMAATKNMPEMKNNVTLKHIKDGTYTGMGQMAMAGNWDVTVTVKRAGKELGSKKFPITAK
jgi:nitrogen fixation protein FixH